ncbi:MAG: hypothetical protein LBN18_08535 [Dysgonamonadaceae bacterium]|jgi:hypothetical protein|nr:hypothetical protein [Dysgonamonadaceae bacterium]
MRKLELNGDVYAIPANWDELTVEQIIFLVNLTAKQVTIEEIKLKMLLFCMDAHVNRFKESGQIRFIIQAGKKKYEFATKELQPVMDLFSFLFTEQKGKYLLNPLLTKNPFPTTQCGCVNVYCNAEQGLQCLTYGEFIHLQTYFSAIPEKPESIDNFLSILYKQKNGCTSPALMNKMSQTVKTAIIWYYLGSMHFISEKFPRTFFGGGSPDHNVFENQMRIVGALAGNDLTKREQVNQSLLYDALYTMEIAAENSQKK